MAIITISYEIGSLGDAIALSLSRKLNYEHLDLDGVLDRFLSAHANPYELKSLKESPKAYLRTFADPRNDKPISYQDYLKEVLPEYAASHPGVWVGSLAQQFLRDEPDVTHIRIVASDEKRVQRLTRSKKISRESALLLIRSHDKYVNRLALTLFESDVHDMSYYDLIINTDRLTLLAATNAIVASWKDLFARKQIEKEEKEDFVLRNNSEIPKLKNQSEIAFARLLDGYGVEWRYEPKTFPVEWDENGRVTLAFSPDFYLTDYDMYLELTTMDQKYVNIKNRKARMAKELYGVNVKIIYRKDFEDMVNQREFNGVHSES